MIARKLLRKDDFISYFESSIWASECCETDASQVRFFMLCSTCEPVLSRGFYQKRLGSWPAETNKYVFQRKWSPFCRAIAV